MVQDRLSTLVGRPSGYVEQLPPQVKKRITGLKGIQQQHAKIENEFQLEILELEKKVSRTQCSAAQATCGANGMRQC